MTQTSQRGIGLLEVVVTMVLLGLLTVLLTTSMRFGSVVGERQTNAIIDFQNQAVANRTLANLISSASTWIDGTPRGARFVAASAQGPLLVQADIRGDQLTASRCRLAAGDVPVCGGPDLAPLSLRLPSASRFHFATMDDAGRMIWAGSLAAPARMPVLVLVSRDTGKSAAVVAAAPRSGGIFP